jgi:hypothetical protein
MTTPNEVSPEQVAQWMVAELNRVNWLYQQEAVFAIEQKFGKQFVYENSAGNQAIAREVLAAFRKLTGDSVVWERGERIWRKRLAYDVAGRQQP